MSEEEKKRLEEEKQREENRKLGQKFSSESEVLNSRSNGNITAAALQYDVDTDSAPKLVALGSWSKSVAEGPPSVVLGDS